MTINSKVKDALIFSATIILGLFLLDLYMGYKIFDASFGINIHFTQYKFLNACYEIKEKGLLKFLLGWHLIIYILIIPGIVAYSYPLYYFIRYILNINNLSAYNLFIIILFGAMCIRGVGYFSGGFIFCILELFYCKKFLSEFELKKINTINSPINK